MRASPTQCLVILAGKKILMSRGFQCCPGGKRGSVCPIVCCPVVQSSLKKGSARVIWAKPKNSCLTLKRFGWLLT